MWQYYQNVSRDDGIEVKNTHETGQTQEHEKSSSSPRPSSGRQVTNLMGCGAARVHRVRSSLRLTASDQITPSPEESRECAAATAKWAGSMCGLRI